MSINFDTESDYKNVAVKGVFFVKLPSNVRGKSDWKVWSPKLLVIKPCPEEVNNRMNNNQLIMSVFKNVKSQSNSKGFIIKEVLNPGRTIIFRCKSRKKPHAFTIYGEGRPLIHISGDSESESQLLIKSIRNLLWPPNPFLSLSKTLGGVFDVSVIDNEKSYRAGLLGVSGYLTVTSQKVSLTCPQTGHVIQEWSMSTVSFKLVPQRNQKDNNKVINMLTTAESNTGYGNILMYCEESLELINQVQRVRLMAPRKAGGYSEELFEFFSTSLPAEYDIMSHFDEDYYQSPRGLSECSTGSNEQGGFSFDRPLEDSPFDLSCSWSTSSSSWPGTDKTSPIYDIPRNPGYATIRSTKTTASPESLTSTSTTNDNSFLSKMISNLSSSDLNCSINLNYSNTTKSILSSSFRATSSINKLDEDHIYEEIDGNNDEVDDEPIYAVIKPIKKQINLGKENYSNENLNIDNNLKPSKSTKLRRNTIDITENHIKYPINQEKLNSKASFYIEDKSINHNYKLRRALSESWTNCSNQSSVNFCKK